MSCPSLYTSPLICTVPCLFVLKMWPPCHILKRKGKGVWRRGGIFYIDNIFCITIGSWMGFMCPSSINYRLSNFNLGFGPSLGGLKSRILVVVNWGGTHFSLWPFISHAFQSGFFLNAKIHCFGGRIRGYYRWQAYNVQPIISPTFSSIISCNFRHKIGFYFTLFGLLLAFYLFSCQHRLGAVPHFLNSRLLIGHNSIGAFRWCSVILGNLRR